MQIFFKSNRKQGPLSKNASTVIKAMFEAKQTLTSIFQVSGLCRSDLYRALEELEELDIISMEVDQLVA